MTDTTAAPALRERRGWRRRAPRGRGRGAHSTIPSPVTGAAPPPQACIVDGPNLSVAALGRAVSERSGLHRRAATLAAALVMEAISRHVLVKGGVVLFPGGFRIVPKCHPPRSYINAWRYLGAHLGKVTTEEHPPMITLGPWIEPVLEIALRVKQRLKKARRLGLDYAPGGQFAERLLPNKMKLPKEKKR